MRLSGATRWTGIFLLWLLLAGCRGGPAAPVIHLADLQPLPPASATSVIPLRVAVAAVISPKGTVESYQPLLDYLGARLSRPVELVQRRTYAEVNDLVENGQVDMAFVCTSAYIAGHAEFGMELLAAPLVNGEAIYYSALIVPANSPAESMADLRGKVFAFTDPMSTSGRMYPTLLVLELGSAPERFFSRTFFTYSHDDAIRAVAEGLADGAAVDSIVYDFALERDPALAGKTRVIHRSPPLGIPPAVAGPRARPQLKAELQALLTGMAGDPGGGGPRALQSIGVERFVPIEDSAYDSARALLARVQPVVK
jgi:phosphonate transport system substrate-binding protein